MKYTKTVFFFFSVTDTNTIKIVLEISFFAGCISSNVLMTHPVLILSLSKLMLSRSHDVQQM